MTTSRRHLLGWAAACAAAPLSALANTAFPRKPVTLVVPFAPGGNLDLVARAIAPALQGALGQSIVVDNRAGAGGAIGATAVARAEADGHTLLVTTPNALVVLPRMVKTGYTLQSFEPVGLVSGTALVLATSARNTRLPDVAALLRELRARPGEITAGHAGPGTTNHVALMLLEEAAGARFNLVAYKGSAPALVDAISGQTDLICDQLSSSIQHIQSGALRPLAVLSKERDPQLPNVPTLHEAGLAGFDATTSTGLLAPRGTPAEVVAALNAALARALADTQVRQRLQTLGSTPRPLSAAAFGQLLQQEDQRAQKLAQSGRLAGANT
ncbi:tripartite tricarboxylate transporter substrate binding protein [Acidovorax sp. MR-S7]|uniref:tripartite tricarboxylate transporter substrate binding protein n=1 Tax=Acidovorax sp. MR-S7 TaxID=1268622 RepID=UPI00036DC1C2|nr:tripartite tricarboxylate transporter substrate binding protein [Acidovorax sp. MR-S7]GAD22291.1 hypothetical protein AVS7_02051 [Acidovorax sp. MR-S7]